MLIKFNNYLVIKDFPVDEMGVSLTTKSKKYTYIVGRNWTSISFSLFIPHKKHHKIVNKRFFGIIYFNGFDSTKTLKIEIYKSIKNTKPLLKSSLKKRKNLSETILSFKQNNRNLYYAH